MRLVTFSRLHTHTLYRTSYGPRVRFLQYCTSLICSASDFQFCNLLKKKKRNLVQRWWASQDCVITSWLLLPLSISLSLFLFLKNVFTLTMNERFSLDGGYIGESHLIPRFTPKTRNRTDQGSAPFSSIQSCALGPVEKTDPESAGWWYYTTSHLNWLIRTRLNESFESNDVE